MRLRMLAPAIARVIEHRRRRPGAAEGLVIAHVDPTSPGVGLALGQNGHGGIVPMQPLGRHHMGLHQAKDRIEHCADRSHGVRHGRQRDRHAFQGVAFGLTVQRLVLAKLFEHDHRQQARTRPSSWDDVERRRRLADLLAIAAGELLAHRLDHLPLTGLQLQRPRHVLAELAQAMAAAAFACRRRIDHHALAGKMLWKRIALGALARKSAHGRCVGDSLFRRKLVCRGAGLRLFECQRQLVDQTRRALRLLSVNLALQLGDPQLLLRDQRRVLRGFRPRHRQFRFQRGVFFGKGEAGGVHDPE